MQYKNYHYLYFFFPNVDVQRKSILQRLKEENIPNETCCSKSFKRSIYKQIQVACFENESGTRPERVIRKALRIYIFRNRMFHLH